MNKVLIMVFMASFAVSMVKAQHQNVVIGTMRNPNEPSIVINPANTSQMMAGANLDNFYFSSDGGYTWSENRLTSSAHGVWGDPCIVVDTLGNFYYFHLSNPPVGSWIDRIVCQRTDNNGLTWNDGAGIGLNGTKAQDKEWVVLDAATNTLMVTWTQFDSYGSAASSDSSLILFSKSSDLGLTWTEPVRLNEKAGDCIDSDNTVEGALPAIGPEGQIYVAWAGPDGLVFDKSTDGGQTWLSHDIFVSEIPGGWDYDIAGISRANGLPVTCCDLSNGPNRGTIYINWSDQRNGLTDTDIWLVKSTDGGYTWTAPVRVNDDLPGKQQFFCWMTIDQTNGNLWFVFYDRRNYNDNNTDVFMAVSDDGGLTFENFKVSDSPFVPVPSVFFGDYTNVSAHNNVIRPIWTRLHQNQLSIMTAIVNPLLLKPDVPIVQQAENASAFPNPFAGNTTISFKVHHQSQVTLAVYDIVGRQVLNIIDHEWIGPGKYIREFNAESLMLKAGVYYFRLCIDNNETVKRIVYAPL